VEIEDTLAGASAILRGEGDEMPEGAFYLVGTLADARAKHAAMRGAAKGRPEARAP
jgi:F0F1-type ATP synthase beta subunit